MIRLPKCVISCGQPTLPRRRAPQPEAGGVEADVEPAPSDSGPVDAPDYLCIAVLRLLRSPELQSRGAGPSPGEPERARADATPANRSTCKKRMHGPHEPRSS